MQIKNINKQVYRRHLNRVIIAFILCFMILSILFGQLLLLIFVDLGSDVNTALSKVEANQPKSNLGYNATGVLIALIVCSAIINKIKSTRYFSEILYVWQMKQLHNLIYRRLPKIKAAAEQGKQDAFIILTFYYQSLEQIYCLDDNTLTLAELHKAQSQLAEQIQNRQLTATISAEQFNKSMVLDY